MAESAERTSEMRRVKYNLLGNINILTLFKQQNPRTHECVRAKFTNAGFNR